MEPGGDLKPPAIAVAHPAPGPDARAPKSFLPRLLAFALLIAMGSVVYVRALAQQHRHPKPVSDAKALGLFPQQVGTFKLQREWNEYLVTGALIFYWADYQELQGGPMISVGISPVLGAHDTLLCHSARGEDWIWHGNLSFGTAHGVSNFSGSFYNDGARQYLEATTVCTGVTCGQYTSERTHFGLVYSRPDTQTLLSQNPTRPIPILLQTETLDTAKAPDMARAELAEGMRRFLSSANLDDFTRPYREP